MKLSLFRPLINIVLSQNYAIIYQNQMGSKLFLLLVPMLNQVQIINIFHFINRIISNRN